jgi:calcineurin-like phosphoesterase family protein
LTIWLISDWHLDHANCITKFRNPDGSLLRGQFKDVAEMNEYIIERHNAVVKPSDHFYMLGDVALGKSGLKLVKRFNGHGRLLRGNHDIYKTREYLDAGFKEIHGTRVIAGLVLTHVPIHPSSMARWVGNVHGHIHTNPTPEGPYLNVGVEVLNYTPISLEEADLRVRAAGIATTGEVRPIRVLPELVEEIELLGAD